MRCVLEGPPLGPGGEDITWPDQVAPRGRKASSTRKIKPQTSNLIDFSGDRGDHRGGEGSENTGQVGQVHAHMTQRKIPVYEEN